MTCSNYSPRADELCDPCDEHARAKLYDGLVSCLHCNVTMTAGGFQKHRWQVFYRLREHPRSKRVIYINNFLRMPDESPDTKTVLQKIISVFDAQVGINQELLDQAKLQEKINRGQLYDPQPIG